MRYRETKRSFMPLTDKENTDKTIKNENELI